MHASAEIVTVPLLLAGFGIGALASQLGSVTVSAVPDDQSPEVGGLQNTATNIGASLGTALAGSILIAASDHVVSPRHQAQPGDPSVGQQPGEHRTGRWDPVRLGPDLRDGAHQAGASQEVTQAVLDENQQARLDGLRTALAALALLALVALFFSARTPDRAARIRQRRGNPN